MFQWIALIESFHRICRIRRCYAPIARGAISGPYRKWKAEVERFRFLFFPPFPPSDGGFFFLDCLDFLHSTAAQTPSCFSTSRDLLHFFPYSDIRGAMSLLPSDWSKRVRDLLESKLHLTICVRFSLAIYLIFDSNLNNSVKA